MSKEEIDKLAVIAKTFYETLDAKSKDEWYGTQKQIYESVLDSFLIWLDRKGKML